MSSTLFVKPINPNKFKSAEFEREIARALESVANDIMLDFELTTATWKHDVKFTKLLQVGPAEASALVGTDDEIYRYVDKGTRPHKIFPRRAKALRFWSIFIPKSQPNTLTSGYGMIGGEQVYRKYVKHPGTKARNFTKTITKMWQRKFKTRMERAITQAVKACGHAI